MEEEEKKKKEGIDGKEEEEKNEVNGKKEVETAQNMLLKKIFAGIGLLILFILVLAFVIQSQTSFEYNGAVFKKIKESDLFFYQTSVPVLYQGNIVPYNFYIRNNPEELQEEVSFEGELVFLKNVVINMSEDISCEDDKIAVANLVKLYEVLGAEVMKDENASCDEQGRYMYLNIQEANETSVEQYGPACYSLNFKNCEILETTERFMIETFAEAKKEKGY